MKVFRPRLIFPGWAWPTLIFSRVGGCPPCPPRAGAHASNFAKWNDFQNSFTGMLSSKFLAKQLNITPYLKCVATLTCETFVAQNRHAPELSEANWHARLSHSKHSCWKKHVVHLRKHIYSGHTGKHANDRLYAHPSTNKTYIDVGIEATACAHSADIRYDTIRKDVATIKRLHVHIINVQSLTTSVSRRVTSDWQQATLVWYVIRVATLYGLLYCCLSGAVILTSVWGCRSRKMCGMGGACGVIRGTENRERCRSSRAGETQKSDERSLLGEEAVASPSIGNTLWRTSTTFTRSAITPPGLNGFGWNLGHSEYIVWSWPWQILGAIRAEATAGARAEIFFVW